LKPLFHRLLSRSREHAVLYWPDPDQPVPEVIVTCSAGEAILVRDRIRAQQRRMRKCAEVVPVDRAH